MPTLTPVTQQEAVLATAPNVTAPGWVYSAPWNTRFVDSAPAVPRLLTEAGQPIADTDLPAVGGDYVLDRPQCTPLNLDLGFFMRITPYTDVGYSWNYGSPAAETGLPLDLGTIPTPYAKDYDFTGITVYNEPTPLPQESQLEVGTTPVSTIARSTVEGLATTFFYDTFKVALCLNENLPFDKNSTYATVEPYLIADGTSGYSWQDLTYETGDLTWNGFEYTLPDKTVLFGRDSNLTSLKYNYIIVLRPLAGGPPDYELICYQKAGETYDIRPGQAAAAKINGGFRG